MTAVQLATAVQAVLDDHDAIEDFELSGADWAVLKRCGCAHCEDGDGICPMTVQQLVKEHLCELRDRVQNALTPPDCKAEDALANLRAQVDRVEQGYAELGRQVLPETLFCLPYAEARALADAPGGRA